MKTIYGANDNPRVMLRLSFLFVIKRSKKRSFAPPVDNLRSKVSTEAFFLSTQS